MWQRARDSLSKCKSLILIGYSFSPTDFYTRKLLMEAFSNNVLDELIVVNPDPRISDESKRMVRYREFRRFNNLEEFIQFREDSSNPMYAEEE